MKNNVKKIVYVFVSLILIMMYSITAFAANDAKVVYNGGNQNMVMTEGSDLFLNFKTLVPGDKTEQNISIVNNSNEAFRLRLSAETLENMELLDELSITVSSMRSGTNITTVLYSGAASAWKVNTDGSSYIDLGSYTPNYEGQLKVELEVPEKLSNEFAGKEAKIKWTFAMEPSTVEGETETFEQTKGRVPTILGEVVEFVTTGDHAPIVWLITVLILCAVVIRIVVIKGKKLNSNV